MGAKGFCEWWEGGGGGRDRHLETERNLFFFVFFPRLSFWRQYFLWNLSPSSPPFWGFFFLFLNSHPHHHRHFYLCFFVFFFVLGICMVVRSRYVQYNYIAWPAYWYHSWFIIYLRYQRKKKKRSPYFLRGNRETGKFCRNIISLPYNNVSLHIFFSFLVRKYQCEIQYLKKLTPSQLNQPRRLTFVWKRNWEDKQAKNRYFGEISSYIR